MQIEWVEVVRQEIWRPSTTPAASNQPIHERSKKASSHCTSLGEVEVSRPKNWYSTVRIPTIEPMEFVFQYAPLGAWRYHVTYGDRSDCRAASTDWLRAQDIVPLPLVPIPPSTGKRRHDTETEGDSETAISELLDEEEAAVYQRLKVSECP